VVRRRLCAAGQVEACARAVPGVGVCKGCILIYFFVNRAQSERGRFILQFERAPPHCDRGQRALDGMALDGMARRAVASSQKAALHPDQTHRHVV
jgi:hypothetical protein